MSQAIYITGIGTISALGNNVVETLSSVLQQKSGIGNLSLLQSKYGDILPCAEVKLSNKQLAHKLANTNTAEGYSRTALLSMIAAQEAATMAQWHSHSAKSAIVSATSVGGMDQGERFYKQFLNDATNADYQLLLAHDCGSHLEQLATLLNVNEYIATTSTACSSAVNAIIHGIRLIKFGGFERVLVGGTDALSQFTLNGFNSLMILSDQPTKPFDKYRNGLNLGEGAGYLVLESENLVRVNNQKPLANISGYANVCDAYHQTASSPDGDGAYRSMAQAIIKSGLHSTDIDYINTHGTGTINNDMAESIAMQRLFADKMPLFSSTKSLTGHTLAASGGIEAVLSVLAINHGIVPPNVHFEYKMDEVDIAPQNALLENRTIHHVLSNSFGFGGNNSSIVFSKW
jgi:3-oxoacyl-[acyl-carrier-protein] synthase-1